MKISYDNIFSTVAYLNFVRTRVCVYAGKDISCQRYLIPFTRTVLECCSTFPRRFQIKYSIHNYADGLKSEYFAGKHKFTQLFEHIHI